MIATLGTLAGKRGETLGVAQDAFHGRLMGRLDTVERRLSEVEEELASARDEAMAAELRAHNLVLTLARVLHVLRSVDRWVDAGAPPPAPELGPAIEELESAITQSRPASDPHPREPPG